MFFFLILKILTLKILFYLFQGLLQYQILNPEVRWSQMFGTLEENSARLGIVDYSVSQTTLEQVQLLCCVKKDCFLLGLS